MSNPCKFGCFGGARYRFTRRGSAAPASSASSDPFLIVSNAAGRPPAPTGTIVEKAQVALDRIDACLPCLQAPAVVDGLLRRSFVAGVTGLGRRTKSQTLVLNWLVDNNKIEIAHIRGEQWLRRLRQEEGGDGDGSAKDAGRAGGSAAGGEPGAHAHGE